MINYSIIIPHYNIPDLLGRCLRSIPERDDVQVIVVDDNSPGNEKYLSTLPELKRKNVEFYVTKDGLGAGHARNVGLSHAVGKWLIFSDSDDFFVDNFSEILDKYVDENSDIIFFNIKSCDCYDTKKLYDADQLDVYRNTQDDIYLRVCNTEPWGKFIKRDLVVDNEIEFQETKAHNDLLFAVKTGMTAKTVKVVDEPLYWYVIREGSLGHNKGVEPIEKLCDRVKAWHSTQLYLEEKGIKTTFYLPIFTCIRALKKSVRSYFQVLLYIKRNNFYYWRTMKDTIRYGYYRVFDVKALSFPQMLTKESVDSYKKKSK